MEREEILQSAIAGDINAFQTLFAEFQDQLKSYLYRLLTDRDDVDDLTHETFIRAFTKISTFNQDSSLKTWVFKIATNHATISHQAISNALKLLHPISTANK